MKQKKMKKKIIKQQSYRFFPRSPLFVDFKRTGTPLNFSGKLIKVPMYAIGSLIVSIKSVGDKRRIKLRLWGGK